MEKRTIVAIILCALIIALYPYIVSKLYPQKEAAPLPAHPRPAVDTAGIVSQPAQVTKEEEIIFETDKYRVALSNLGGSVKGIELLGYKDKEGMPYALAKTTDARFGPLAIWAPDYSSQAAGGIYEYTKTDSGAIFLKKLPDGVTISKEYKFYNGSYSMGLEIKITNEGESAAAFGYKLLGGSSINTDRDMDGKFLESATLANGKIYREYAGKIKKNGSRKAGEIAWCILKNKYFDMILKPEFPAAGSFSDKPGGTELVAGVDVPPVIIKGKSEIAHKYLFYAGPNDYDELKSYKSRFEETLYGGFFSGISRFLMLALKLINKAAHNWGISIILLTFLISLCLYPLTLKSLRSMKEMQILAPQIELLKSQYKDNPQKLHKETMELYKRHKVNPFGGCFPMLLQMPIYIALYQGLMHAIELRGAKFLWIKDLAAEDALFRIGNFNLNLLPILTAAAMFAQQKLSAPAKAMENEQKILSYTFPLIFAFIFYKFSSGFVLYFLTSTLVMVFYQYRVKAHIK